MSTLTPRNTTLAALSSADLAKCSIARSAPGSIRCTAEKSRTTSPPAPSSFARASCKAGPTLSPSILSHAAFIAIGIIILHCWFLGGAGRLHQASPLVSPPKELCQFAEQWHAGVGGAPRRIVKGYLDQIGHRSLECFFRDTEIGNRPRNVQSVE